ncbi:hypothetical protein F4818DRAFT_65290 [Hypoxylon cercidicola]|nr:hypothetical protein F4818DRAFT_65290 [Hypoxylon cercidicola]
MSSLEKFTLFPRLPAELRIIIWQMIIVDTCPVEPTVCVYWHPDHADDADATFDIPIPTPVTMQVCRESRYETQRKNMWMIVQFDIENQTGAWVNPHREFNPTVDFLYLPFHLFMQAFKRTVDFLPFIQRNRRGRSRDDWCEQCAGGYVNCQPCARRISRFINQQITRLELPANSDLTGSLFRSLNDTLASFGTRGKPTIGDLGFMIQEVNGLHRLKLVILHENSNLLEEFAGKPSAVTGGDKSDFEFMMPYYFPMTFFPKGQWPN